MGRSESRKRPTVVGVRLSDEELSAALSVAGKVGVTLPELMRRALKRLLRVSVGEEKADG